MKSDYSEINGFLLVNKPSGITSRDVVNRVSKVLGTKKIGHTGTLDPLATGLLILTIGKYTKLSDDLSSNYKEYEVEGILGFETTTLDITGDKCNTSSTQVTHKMIVDAINSFKGHYLQEVPKYSAVKINGKKLYQYAREDKMVVLPKREVEIKDIKDIMVEDNIISFTCTVSKGTYIRSLIRDIGVKLGTYATMSKLKRTKIDKFDVQNAYDLKDIENDKFKILSIEDILDTEEINLSSELYKKVSNGAKTSVNTNKKYILYKYNDKTVALYKKIRENEFKMYVKF